MDLLYASTGFALPRLYSDWLYVTLYASTGFVSTVTLYVSTVSLCGFALRLYLGFVLPRLYLDLSSLVIPRICHVLDTDDDNDERITLWILRV